LYVWIDIGGMFLFALGAWWLERFEAIEESDLSKLKVAPSAYTLKVTSLLSSSSSSSPSSSFTETGLTLTRTLTLTLTRTRIQVSSLPPSFTETELATHFNNLLEGEQEGNGSKVVDVNIAYDDEVLIEAYP
jgi:carbohydrate-binding DOMON domain-containing protein